MQQVGCFRDGTLYLQITFKLIQNLKKKSSVHLF